jgi:LuxR family transcriptional regulator, maltose regulon positive regulatory protein
MLMPLLRAKFYIPPPRPHQVRREHLIDRLQNNAARRLTLFSAPAGFGKSTLVSEWLTHLDHAAAWLSLDEDDNEPTRFLTYLIAALQTRQENIGASALGLLAAPEAPPHKAILTLLLNDLDKLITPLALILDDYHVITAPPVHEVVTFFIDHLPSNLRLVITSRIDPPLPLIRWRVRNQLAEVRADDLRFTQEEVATFLNEVMGLTLTADEIMALETRTEGWIAGLQLAAISMQGHADVTGFIQAFSGSHRHVLSYLVEEVLNRCPQGTLDFLLHTAILDQMNAALCDAVTGRRDSQGVLQTLEHANLFVIPLDDAHQWYRYHHLFAEVLRVRLQQAQPEIIPQLHQRASDWYAATGQIEQAVGHALAVPDVEQAATLVERVALATLLQQSEVLLVRRLVERLPVTAIYGRPHLILAYGMTLALSGQYDAVATLLLKAAPALNSLDLPGDVAGGLAMLHSTIARFRGDMEQSLTLSQQALRQLPVDALILRSAAALNIGSAYFRRGERVAAGQALADAITFGSDGGAEYIVQVAFEELATDQARQGLLAQAQETCERALARAMRWGSQRMPSAGMAYVSIGEVYYEWNKLEQASEALTRGIQLLLGTTEMTMFVRGYSALARRQWAGREPQNALATLQQGDEWLARIQTSATGAPAWLAAQRARLHLWQNNLTTALRWERDTHPVGESPLSYLQQLTRVRVRIAQHAHDPQASFLQEATYILAPLLNTAEARGWGSHIIEILLLQALIEQAQGNRAAAQIALTRALILAEPGGFIRIFVDEGEPMQLLISRFRLSNARGVPIDNLSRLSVYADKLLAALSSERKLGNQNVGGAESPIESPRRSPDPKIQELVEPLSSRELEVLQLVASGLSNNQIAAKLIVTTSTIKTHINHIYGKLDVQSRTQVIARARGLGLLTD